MASLLRLHIDLPLLTGHELDLPEAAVRHVQVRRLQPGDELRLFDGRGHEVEARLLRMGRHSAAVMLGDAVAALPEPAQAVTLALGVPANERMDTLVEKATELGVARIQPLITERSVLRLSGERARRRVQHWTGIASAAAEQCGRATVPVIEEWQSLADWLDVEHGSERGAGRTAAPTTRRWLLSPHAEAARPLRRMNLDAGVPLCVLSGPEGGLSAAEEQQAVAAGFDPVSLGPRVLRADTAPLAVMAWLSAHD